MSMVSKHPRNPPPFNSYCKSRGGGRGKILLLGCSRNSLIIHYHISYLVIAGIGNSTRMYQSDIRKNAPSPPPPPPVFKQEYQPDPNLNTVSQASSHCYSLVVIDSSAWCRTLCFRDQKVPVQDRCQQSKPSERPRLSRD